MGRTIQEFGLRGMRREEPPVFAAWESGERPYPWSDGQFRELVSSESPSRLLVLENAAGVGGYAVVQFSGEEGYLSNLMVRPDLRRRGTGVELMQKVMMWLQSEGVQKFVLDVDPANQAAVRLYLKLGFEIIDRRKASYPRGEDALIMRKIL